MRHFTPKGATIGNLRIGDGGNACHNRVTDSAGYRS